jgi:hypothetical protein
MATTLPRASVVIGLKNLKDENTAAVDRKDIFDIPVEVLVELWPWNRLHSGLLTNKRLYEMLPRRSSPLFIFSRVFSRTFQNVNYFLVGPNGASVQDVPRLFFPFISLCHNVLCLTQINFRISTASTTRSKGCPASATVTSGSI